MECRGGLIPSYRTRPARATVSPAASILSPSLKSAKRKVRYLSCAKTQCQLESAAMAKALTKSQIVTSLAQTVGVTKKQAAQTLEAIVVLAYKNAKNTFTLPGLGKLVLVHRKARVGRNPATGATLKIPAKRVVKFRVAKAAKDAILGVKTK